MRNTVWAIALFSVAVLSAFPVRAEFREDEKPVWGMLNETAYTLKGGEWNLDLWGPITYGIVDGLQVGSIFWVWFAQIPNVNAKWNFLPESEMVPAVSIGGSYYSMTFKLEDIFTHDTTDVNIGFYNAAAFISKQITPKFALSGGYIYTGIGATLSNYNTADNWLFKNLTGSVRLNTGFVNAVVDMSPSARLSVEAAAHTASPKTLYDAGLGFEWALSEIFRLKVGVDCLFLDKLQYVPFLDLHWRFK